MSDDNNTDAEVVSEDINRVSPIVPTFGREVIGVFAIGAGVGLVTTAAYWLLDKFVFSAVMCGEGGADCQNAGSYAMIVALIIGTLGGLVAMVQARVYRPLLAALAAVISLWGFDSIIAGMTWYWPLLIAVAVFGFTYLMFSWFARIRSFVMALIITATLVVAARVIMTMS